MRLILCEGPHAMSALDGALGALQCVALLDAPRPSWFKPKEISSKTNLHQFRTANGVHLCVQWLEGKDNVFPALNLRLTIDPIADCDALAVCFDPDAQTETQWRQSIESQIPGGRGARTPGFHYETAARGTRIFVHPLPWRRLSDEAGAAEQLDSLYSLVTSALARTKPERSPLLAQIEELLRTEEVTLSRRLKRRTWLHMAVWQTEDECREFFKRTFRDEALIDLLEGSGQMKDTWAGLRTLAT